MTGKRLCACARWSSERAGSGLGGSVMTSALPSERNQSHTLPLSLSHHSQQCQNSAHGISTFTFSLRGLRSRAVSLPYSAKDQRVLKSFSRVRKRPLHLFVRTNPSTLPSDVPRLIKGRSSRLLRQEFAHVRKLPTLWTHSYFLSTAGNVSSETIQRYIEQQSECEGTSLPSPQ